MERRGRLFFWIVMSVGALLLLARLDASPLIDPDEARFARTSVEMLRSGDLVVPTFEHRPRLAKPPLLHWTQMALFSVFGPSELAARLPSALATLASMMLVAWIARRRFGEEGGAWAAAIFITQPLVLALGRTGTTDALLSLHVLAALALDIAEPDETSRQRGAAIGALLGMAFLAKGPVGVVLPLLVILAGRTASGRPVVPRLGTVAVFLAAWSVVALPWGLAFIERLGAGTAAMTLRDEVWHRYFAAEAHHARPPWYFGAILLAGAFPWVATLPLALVRVLAQRRGPAARTGLYAGAGLLIGLAMFSLGSGKMPQYILPLMPLVAILATWELGREIDAARFRNGGPVLLNGALFVMMFALGTLAVARDDPAVRATAICGAVAYGIGGIAAVPGLLRSRPRQVYGAAFVAGSVLLLVAATVLHPSIGRYRSTAELIERVPQLESERPVVLVEINLPSLTYYLDRVPERIPAARIDQRIERGDDPILVLADSDLSRLAPRQRRRLRELGGAGKLRALERTERPRHDPMETGREPNPA